MFTAGSDLRISLPPLKYLKEKFLIAVLDLSSIPGSFIHLTLDFQQRHLAPLSLMFFGYKMGPRPALSASQTSHAK